ncbi:uncharacterized protein SPSC_03537 [Sporisorium scitamineum]|uniref:Secreted protein n=1 Tax=Sporisorium scitamineum TaxID=49012 RepID=A0A140KN46_9BASI|nr:uncharacterized protein SPSC_03537 [Sporisorium scitamineum]
MASRIYLIGVLWLLRCALCIPAGFEFDLNKIPVETIENDVQAWMHPPVAQVGHDTTAQHVQFDHDAHAVGLAGSSTPLQGTSQQLQNQPPSPVRHPGSLAAPQEMDVSQVVESTKPNQMSLGDASIARSSPLKRPFQSQFQAGSSQEMERQHLRRQIGTLPHALVQSEPSGTNLPAQSEQSIGTSSRLGPPSASDSLSNDQDSASSQQNTHASIPVLGSPIGSIQGASITLPIGDAASSSSYRPLLPARELGGHKKGRRMKIPFSTHPELSALVKLDEAGVRAQSLKDPSAFSGAIFDVTIHDDANVGRLIAGLRSSILGSTNNDLGGELSRAPLSLHTKREPLRFLGTYFKRSQLARLVHFEGADRTRSFFLIRLNNYRWIARRSDTRYVGVWEIASNPHPESLVLYFLGFYPFSTSEFVELGEHQQVRSFYLKAKHPFHGEQRRQGHVPESVALKVWIFKAPDLASREEQADDLNPILQAHPDMQKLSESGQLRRILAMNPLLQGRHLYVYQQSPRTQLLIKQLKAGLERLKATPDVASDPFQPIELPEAQIRDFSAIASKTYRKPKKVKAIKEENGEVFMLDFFPRFGWVKPSRPNIILIWQFGPAIEGKRLLFCRGIYRIDRRSYQQLTPSIVRGLQDFVFQYNTLELP